MIEKIFSRLKQKYAHIGLGDSLLRSHAENLAAMGFVTDENIESVIDGQKGFLESLQKANDSRVSEAVATAKRKSEEDAKKQIEEAKKQAEETARKKFEDDAKKRADEEARKKAEEDAERQAEEDERKKQEELQTNNEIPQWFKDLQVKQEENSKKERAAYDAKIAELTNANTATKATYDAMLKKLEEENRVAQEKLNKITSEAEAAKAAAAKKERADKILSIAKGLGIPQSRIDEGFVIADDAKEEDINSYLSKVAENAKASNLPKTSKFPLDTNMQASKADVDKIVDSLIQ